METACKLTSAFKTITIKAKRPGEEEEEEKNISDF